MTRLGNTLVDGSRTPLLLQSAASPLPDETEVARLFEAICGQGECMQLRPQQRVPLPPAEKVAVLREGMIAIDAMPAKGKLQVLDFLVEGDVVSTSTLLPAPGVSLRAITGASLVTLDPSASDGPVPTQEFWTFLIAQCLSQLARVNVHQLIIGRLETESRVASFLLGLALRNIGEHAPEITVPLPMSRTDIANYLVINCDTLSRTMMRFSDCGLIERVSRHVVRVIDLDALRKKSPLAPLLSAVFEKEGCRQKGSLRHLESAESVPLVPANHGVVPAVVTAGPLSLSSAGRLHASRGGW